MVQEKFPGTEKAQAQLHPKGKRNHYGQ